MDKINFIKKKLIAKVLNVSCQIISNANFLIEQLNKIDINNNPELQEKAKYYLNQLNIIKQQAIEIRQKTKIFNQSEFDFDLEELITECDNISNSLLDFQTINNELLLSNYFIDSNGKLNKGGNNE